MDIPADNRINKALLYITKHFDQALSTETLAAAAGLSPFHFHRLFLKQTGETPAGYMLRLRMEHATHLIRLFPQKPLAEIALLSGYVTPAEFSRVFKKYFGFTARTYLQTSPNNNPVAIKDQKSAFPVFYLRKIHLSIASSNLTDSGLSSLFSNFRKKHPKGGQVYSVLIDVPFHTPAEKCRFYLGKEMPADKKELQYTIPEGYYTSLIVSGNFQSILEKLVAFKAQQLDPSPYEIASIIAFEKLVLPANDEADVFNYFEAERQLFIKLQRK